MDDFPHDGPLSRNIDRETLIMKSKQKVDSLKMAHRPLLRVFLFIWILIIAQLIFGAGTTDPSMYFMPIGIGAVTTLEVVIIASQIKKEIAFQEKTRSEKE